MLGDEKKSNNSSTSSRHITLNALLHTKRRLFAFRTHDAHHFHVDVTPVCPILLTKNSFCSVM